MFSSLLNLINLQFEQEVQYMHKLGVLLNVLLLDDPANKAVTGQS